MYLTSVNIEFCLDEVSTIFRELPDRDKDALQQSSSIMRYKRGESIFYEGELSPGLFCIISGKVKVYKEGVGGREQILKLLKERSFLGYHALFNEAPWPVSASAIDDTSICLFERKAFIKLLKRNGELATHLLKMVADEVCFSERRTVSLTQKHIRGRIAESLLVLRDIYGFETDGRTLGVSLSREEIANLSNMTTSNAIRTLSTIASEGIIELKGRKISIINVPHLEHISQLG
jgi:CRP-like cAMP-binding protein